jgi:hypothetical protein
VSRVSSERRVWQCPGCGRNFRIPAGAESPRLCPECIAGEATVALNQPAGAAGAATASSTAFDERPTPAGPSPAFFQQAALADAASIAESLRSISTHLESMSRSMRVVRRLAWGILLSSVLIVLIYGYMAWMGMSTMQQITNPLGGGGGQDLLGPLQEYQRALNDALQQ